MKKSIFNFVLVAIALVAAISFTSCDNREYSKEMAAQAGRDADVRNVHLHPVDGEIANGILKFRCVDSFYVDWAEQHFAGTHFCNSQYQIYGAESNTIASLEGCYDVDANGNIVGTELSLSFIRDEVEQALATFRGIDDPVDFSRRIAETDTCHYEPFKACFDKTNRRLTVYGLGEHGDTAVATGMWYGIIHDTTTVVVRDTLIVHDTVNHRDTITLTDTVFVHDSIVTTNTVQYIVEHLYWIQTVQLINGKLYVSGVDKVTKNVYNNGVLVSSTSVNFNHRSRFAIAGFNGVVFNQSVDDCVAIVNGAATINGHSFQIVWEADEIVGNVIVGGDNVTSQLVACHATASQLCATSDGHLVIHFVDGNDEIATYTTTYTTETPTTPLFPNAVGAWASDEYTTAVVTSMSQRITNVIVIEPDGSNYKYFRGVLTAGMTRADFDSVSITAAEYTWLMGKIAAGYVPAIVADHNSTAEYRGAVKSEDQSSYWKLTYDIQAGTAYVMSQSAWTISGYNGRNANRGVMNATTGKLVADGVTLQVRN